MNKNQDKFSMAEFYDIMESIKEGVEQGYYSGGFDPTIDEEVDPELFKLFQEYSLDRNNVVHWQLLTRALSNFIRVGIGGRSLEWTTDRKRLLIERAYQLKKRDPHGISIEDICKKLAEKGGPFEGEDPTQSLPFRFQEAIRPIRAAVKNGTASKRDIEIVSMFKKRAQRKERQSPA
ncbi:hypothetical protein GA0061098_102133 [Bradyrhizobium shewense]|uniref:Uncharacterized protein n=1 Tax=Bradyrhizobium shewense TaxID=1761772 RepID=A0A1C3XP48_9BRAD|nr:hypothetical protein [Bradyrhizobium shewense]SCB53826.1 hypothetical protein GA0061098_102133 [Bradyrhizobium shewense]